VRRGSLRGENLAGEFPSLRIAADKLFESLVLEFLFDGLPFGGLDNQQTQNGQKIDKKLRSKD
jgi:hypothetical protein